MIKVSVLSVLNELADESSELSEMEPGAREQAILADTERCVHLAEEARMILVSNGTILSSTTENSLNGR
jgi:hypothetical protein